MKVLLLNSPWTHPYHPGLATPSLTAFLKQQGITVSQRDLSLEALIYCLAPKFLRRCRARVERRLQDCPRGEKAGDLAAILLKGEMAIEEIDRALDIFRSAAYFEINQLYYAKNILAYTLALVSAAHAPARWLEGYFEIPGAHQSSTLAAWAAADDRANPFHDYYTNALIPSLVDQPPDLIGISVSLDQMSQLIPALALARILRQYFPEAHIVAGGIVFSKLEKQRASFAPFFNCFDSIVLFEGETALSALVESLDHGREDLLTQVPNLLLQQKGQVVSTSWQHVEDVRRLPCPDYTGLPLDQYLSPHPMLAFSIGRGGCYWARCTFCDTRAGQLEKHRTRPMGRVIDDMEGLHHCHGVNHFVCIDEAVSINNFIALSEGLLRRRLDFHWACWSRAEKGFDRSVFERMHRAGCRMLTFGLESGSQRVLQDMDKGITATSMPRIMADCRQAGIAAAINIILGYPGESRDELNESIDLAFALADTVVKANLLPFFYKANTHVHKTRICYPTDVWQGPEDDLVIFYNHRYTNGQTQDDVNRLCEEVEAALVRNNTIQRLLARIGQHPAGFLYLSHFGLVLTLARATAYYASINHEAARSPGLRPRVAPSIRIIEPSAVVRDRIPSSLPGRVAVLDVLTNAIGWLPGHVGRILSLCDGHRPIDKIAARLERHLTIGPTGNALILQALAALPSHFLQLERGSDNEGTDVDYSRSHPPRC